MSVKSHIITGVCSLLVAGFLNYRSAVKVDVVEAYDFRSNRRDIVVKVQRFGGFTNSKELFYCISSEYSARPIYIRANALLDSTISNSEQQYSKDIENMKRDRDSLNDRLKDY